METKVINAIQLPVMEAFYTIQGEGVYQGQAAYFIRLGGCDVGCVWCDVKESWDANAHPVRSVEEIVGEAVKHPARLAVITGGEPMMHDLGILTRSLKEAGFRTHVETSGAHPFSGEFDWVCLSPKKFKPALEEYYEKADELKVVVYHPSDLEWAEGHGQKVNPSCQQLLQPEWSRHERVMPLIVEHVKKYPQWHISLQTHKFMDVP